MCGVGFETSFNVFIIEASSLYFTSYKSLRILHNFGNWFHWTVVTVKKYALYFQLEFVYLQFLIIRSWNAFNVLWNTCSSLKITF